MMSVVKSHLAICEQLLPALLFSWFSVLHVTSQLFGTMPVVDVSFVLVCIEYTQGLIHP